jgi:protein TonB
MRPDTLRVSLLSSIAIHVCAMVIAAVSFHPKAPRSQNYFAVHLIETPRAEISTPEPVPPPQTKTPAAPVRQVESPNKDKTHPVKNSMSKPESTLAATTSEPLMPPETKAPAANHPESTPPALSSKVDEDGGSAAGMSKSSGGVEIGGVPGTGIGLGGGGTGVVGRGAGAGPPGLGGSSVLRTSREAKPIQTARAVYPPMALRMGLESDVTLRIEVDPEGKVTTAEIIKSGGAGFDEEALKAVKQSRFEPAQKDDSKVPAEFTYIYRFRLQK